MAWRTGEKTPQAIGRIKRRALVRQDMLNGLTNQLALAARHGVCHRTAFQDVHAILKEMNEEQKELGKQELIIALNRLEDNVREATNAWERSKQNREEIRTEYLKKECKECKGTGMKDGDEDTEEWCWLCDGIGWTKEEVVTRKVSGQAGDQAFLKERRECIKTKMYLLGYKPVDKGGRPRKNVHLHNTSINVTNIDSKEVMDALVGLSVLKKSALEAKVIEAKDE